MIGLHPVASRDAQTWLRGEEDCLSPDRRAELLLSDRPPAAIEVLRGIATLLQTTNKILVVCFDQMEFLLQAEERHFDFFRPSSMSWIQEVPNLLITVGVLESEWLKRMERDTYEPFQRRCDLISLPPLKPEDAVEMVVRRIDSWEGRSPSRRRGSAVRPGLSATSSRSGIQAIGLDQFLRTRIRQLAINRPDRFDSTENGRRLEVGIYQPMEFSTGVEQEAELPRRRSSRSGGVRSISMALEAGRLGDLGPNPLKQTAASKRPGCTVSLSRDARQATILLTFIGKMAASPLAIG